jgi:two-component system, cell cycle sensor histidine kinase and response regulator CckA
MSDQPEQPLSELGAVAGLQAALEESERRWRCLFDEMTSAASVHEIICDDDGRPVDFRCLRVNAAFEKVTRLSAAQVIGRTAREVLPIDDSSIARYGRVALTGAPVEFEAYFAPLGRFFETRAFRIQPGQFAIVFRDISKHVQSEEELRSARAQLDAIVQASPLGIIVVDPAGIVLQWNAAAERIFGHGATEVRGRRAPFLPEDREGEVWQALLATVRGEGRSVAPLARRKDGGTIDLVLSTAPLRGPGGAVDSVLAIVADVTQQRRLEAQYLQAQKLEAIGRLAGGVAHDFNNVLTTIACYTDILQAGVERTSPLYVDLEEIQRAAQRGAELTSQLLAFSRKQVIKPVIIDLNQVITRSRRMLGRIIGEDVELVFLPGQNVARVKADPGQIEQVLVNLAVNGRDAMPAGGRLSIETCNAILDEQQCHTHPAARPGAWVMLSVSDNGSGMSSEVQQHIFEPFFTTKEQGKGTGLGLATVYGIVQQSGGFITVESREGAGTSFGIHLPVAEGAEAVVGIRRTAGEVASGEETVLLVEDEAAVRNLARKVLQRLGYVVLEASDGESALKICERHLSPVHLLLTDVVMPGMNGKELYERLHAQKPELRALFMSGYTDEAIARHGVRGSETNFLQKPFTVEMLARKVREVLDR